MISVTTKAAKSTAIIAVVLFIPACATFTPGSIDQLTVQERAQTIEKDGIRVSTSVLSREEASYLFGAELHERGVQPVWLEIENRTEERAWFMLHGLDPNYFSAREVAYMNHRAFSGAHNRNMDRYFSDLGIDQYIPPGATLTGFAFSNETIGTKEVRVRLLVANEISDFEFFVTVPGIVSDWEKRDLGKLYAENELIKTETDEDLFEKLTSLPCCTQRNFGDNDGAPVNVILIGNAETLRGLLKAGWDETVFRQDVQNFFAANYLYNRTPDVQFEKSRRRVNSTNLLRLWVTPLRHNGRVVAIGSIKRNIDPDIDESALYLLEDLATAGAARRFGFVGGIARVPRSKPREIFGGGSYWTAGQRVVIELTDNATPLDEIAAFSWDWEGKSIAVDAAASTDSAAVR